MRRKKSTWQSEEEWLAERLVKALERKLSKLPEAERIAKLKEINQKMLTSLMEASDGK